MGEFFGSIYCWLDQFFGLELANYLWGLTSPYQQGNMFIGIGLSMLGITLLMAVVYYYAIDHPRLNSWWGWGISLAVNAIINFIVGWHWVLKDYYAGKMVGLNPITGKLEALLISQSDIAAFGVTNMLDAIIAFFIFSCIIKWWSTNCSHAPF